MMALNPFRGLFRRRPGRKRARGRFSSEEGSLVIETALSLLVVVPLVFWFFELCMMTYTYSVLGDAARQGVRYAIVHGTDSGNCSGPSIGCADLSGANVVAVVDNAAAMSFHNLSDMTVQVSYPDLSSAPSSRVNVTVDYTYVPYIKLPWILHSVELSAQGRISY
ncbi:MAG: TadE/TadG family type IV pilus assembly protein [Acidobacteriaceae bacterium]